MEATIAFFPSFLKLPEATSANPEMVVSLKIVKSSFRRLQLSVFILRQEDLFEFLQT